MALTLDNDCAEQVDRDLPPRLSVVDLLEEQAPQVERLRAVRRSGVNRHLKAAEKKHSSETLVRTKNVMKQKLAQTAIHSGVSEWSMNAIGKLMIVAPSVRTPIGHKLIARRGREWRETARSFTLRAVTS